MVDENSGVAQFSGVDYIVHEAASDPYRDISKR